MKWSAEYATGIERVDQQHQMLFQMAENFNDSLTEGRGERVYGNLLGSLDAYARAHFGFEDRCMTECHCPAAEANRDAHAKFIEALAEFRRRYAAIGFDRTDARSLTAYIEQSLTDHICRIDIQLRGCAKKDCVHETQAKRDTTHPALTLYN